MSTSCYICKHIKDGMVKGIFVSHDGYPDYILNILKDHYNTEKSIDGLLNFGNLRELGNTPIESEPYFNKNNGGQGNASNEDLLDAFRDEDYCYVWVKGTWYYKDRREAEIFDTKGELAFNDPFEMNAKLKLSPPIETVEESKGFEPGNNETTLDALLRKALYTFAKAEFENRMRASRYYMKPEDKKSFLDSIAEEFLDAAVGFSFEEARSIAQEVSELPLGE